MNAPRTCPDIAFGLELNSLRNGLEKRAYQMCRCQTEAEDLASTAILKAWIARAKFQPGTNMMAWVFFIMRNEFLTRKRREKFSGGSIDDIPLGLMPSAPGAQESHMDLQDVISALQHVRVEYRTAMLLVGEGATYEEAAEELVIAVGTVKSRVGRGRDSLRELLS